MTIPFKYKQELFAKTEYNEALAFYIYSYLNKIDFNYWISKRHKSQLNLFPDFVIRKKYLEVTRSLDELQGKQQQDVLDVFGKENVNDIVISKNVQLQKYKEKGYDHQIEFYNYNGVATAELNPPLPSKIISNIVTNIIKKNDDAKEKNIDNVIDLFVINYESLNQYMINCIVDKLKNVKLIFDNVYIDFPFDYSKFKVLIINKDLSYKIICPLLKIDKNYIADIVFNLEWLDKKEFSK